MKRDYYSTKYQRESSLNIVPKVIRIPTKDSIRVVKASVIKAKNKPAPTSLKDLFK